MSWHNPIEGWDVPRGFWAPDELTREEESFWEMVDKLAELENWERMPWAS